MKKIFLVLFSLFSVLMFSQKDYIKYIDSISQKRWDSAGVSLDSISEPKLFNLKLHFRDTIVVREGIAIPNITNEIPYTPFNLIKYKREKKWYFYGQNNLVFNQAAFSNWNAGGNNNIGILGKINYNLSYKNGKHFFENILLAGYGFVTTKGISTRKTDDYLNLMSNYGYELGKNYYLSTGFQFSTQFAPGYNYSATPDPSYSNRISKFMAPAYLNLGLGISYNPNENLQIIVRPINGKFTFITDPLLQKAGKYGLERNGQSFRAEIGARVNFLYNINIMKNMNLVNQLNFFSNYIDHPERLDVNYYGQLNIRFNEFISAVVSIDLLYDHDQIEKLQLKQSLGIGFSYNMGANTLQKNTSKKVIKPFIN